MATLNEVSSHLQMGISRLKVLIDRGIISKKERGEYDIDEARKQYILHIRKQASGHSGSDDGLDLSAERARLAKEQADSQEMKNAIERGELVRVEDVAKVVGNSLSRVRTRLMAIPSKNASLVMEAATLEEARDALDEAIREALSEMVSEFYEG